MSQQNPINNLERTCKVYFQDNVPFSQFLKQEKEELGLTWPEMDQYCGVHKIRAYVYNNTSQGPNYPPFDKFLQIITRLGYERADFKFNEQNSLVENRKKSSSNPEEYKKQLIKIGEKINALNDDPNRKRDQLLSTTLIRKVAGERFYHRYAYSIEARIALHQELISSNPEFAKIKLQSQNQNKNDNRTLEQFEEETICDLLLKIVENHEQENYLYRLPDGTFQIIKRELNKTLKEKGFNERSRQSIAYHAARIWYGCTPKITLENGSPKPNQQILNKNL